MLLQKHPNTRRSSRCFRRKQCDGAHKSRDQVVGKGTVFAHAALNLQIAYIVAVLCSSFTSHLSQAPRHLSPETPARIKPFGGIFLLPQRKRGEGRERKKRRNSSMKNVFSRYQVAYVVKRKIRRYTGHMQENISVHTRWHTQRHVLCCVCCLSQWRHTRHYTHPAKKRER